jgi:hypothetical protein
MYGTRVYSETLVLDNEESFFSYSSSLLYFVDESEKESWESIRSKTFSSISERGTNFGYTKDQIWFQFDLINLTENNQWILVLDYPLLDFFDLYVMYPDGTEKVNHGGDRLNFSERFFPYRFINFKLDVPKGSKAKIFFRVQSSGSVQISGKILTPIEFARLIKNDSIKDGIYFGGLILIGIYNFFVFLFIKDRKYLYYCLYLAAYIITQASLNGLLFETILYNNPLLANQLLIFFMCISFFMALNFTELYLDIKNHPKVYKLTYMIKIIFLTHSVLSLGLEYNISVKIMSILGPMGAILILFLGFHALYNKNREAKYFLTAWGIFMLGVLTYSVKTAGLVPTTFITNYAIQIGSLSEALLLSIGLAYQIERLRKQSEYLNDNLQKEVQIRTKELEAQKDKAEKALADLQDSKEALTKSERDSSINQISAHLAHEVNNPLNYIATGEFIIEENLSELKSYIHSMLPEDPDSEKVRKKFEEYFESLEIGLKQSKEGSSKIKNTISEIRAITMLDGVQVRNFDIMEVLRESIQVSFEKNQVDTNHLTLKIDEEMWPNFPSKSLTILSQKHILARALRTLISNGIFFTRKKSGIEPEIRIKIESITTNGKPILLLYIYNNGPFVEPGKEAELFDLKNISRNGTELIGIPMVKELLKSIQCNLTLIDNGRESGWVGFQIMIKNYD